MNINANTKTICLIGHPVKHSFSPIIHNYLFKKYKLDDIYVCFDVKENMLNEAIQGIKSLNIVGTNVTIPHKVNVIKYLDYIETNAKIIGAVNTIKNEGGVLRGYNTDGIGFVKSIIDKGYKLRDKKIIVLGAGGAARSICVELAASNVKYIKIINRSLESAKKIESIILENFNTKIICTTETLTEKDLKEVDILINTTPVGMESEECPIDEKLKVSKKILVCDIVYKPHNTKFIEWAKHQHLDIVYGIDMLINQASEAFYIWTNIKPTLEDEEEIKELYRKRMEEIKFEK